MRYRLRTLLVVLAIGPPLLAGTWFGIQRYRAWREALLWTEVAGPGAVYYFEINCRFDAEVSDDSD